MEQIFSISFWLIPIIKGFFYGCYMLANALITMVVTTPISYFVILGILSLMIDKAKKRFC